MNDTNPVSGALVPPFEGEYVPKLFTAADLAEMPSDLPSGPVRYELHHGRLITMPPPGDLHGAIDSNLICALKMQGEHRKLGKARSEVGILLSRNPDHLLGPDAVFIANERLPLKVSEEGYLLTIPHLIVEVRSKNDTLAAMGRKADDYLKAGAVVVWIVDPIKRNVIERRANAEARTFTEDDTLTVEDIIPGFALSVRQVLQE